MQTVGVRWGILYALPPGTIKCVFQRLFAKNDSYAALRKLWFVIVGCRDCNNNVNLVKFCAVVGRSSPPLDKKIIHLFVGKFWNTLNIHLQKQY